MKWIGKRLKDLFYGNGNKHLDLGRVLSLFAVMAPLAAAGWNVYLGLEIQLGEFGGGIAAVVTACAVLIASKDAQQRKAKDAAVGVKD